MRSTTIKRLFAVAGNRCAFENCQSRLIDRDVIIGEMCHIKAKEPGGPRYDSLQTVEERDAFENIVIMCGVHHKIIDTKPDEYPVEVLQQLKQSHEKRFEQPSDEMVGIITLTINERPEVTSYNQQGGQTANQITNIFHSPPKPAPPTLVPMIESHMTSADNVGQIDYYAFRVSLRNDGEKTVRDFRLEVEVPVAYADPTHPGSMMGGVCRVREDVQVYRHTSEKHFPNFILFPNDKSDGVLNTNYQMRFDQYKDASGSIKVTVYSDDDRLSSVHFSIKDNRNKDRMNHLGLAS